jgi:hypothetical protein
MPGFVGSRIVENYYCFPGFSTVLLTVRSPDRIFFLAITVFTRDLRLLRVKATKRRAAHLALTKMGFAGLVPAN